MCVAVEEAAQHAGHKAQAWAARWAVPTATELCGLAEAVAAVAGKRRDNRREGLVLEVREHLLLEDKANTDGTANRLKQYHVAQFFFFYSQQGTDGGFSSS